MSRVGLVALFIAGSLLGTCAANSAPKVVQASVLQNSGQVWSVPTPFGIIYGVIPREIVDYPAAQTAGTIVVSTNQRRLYYVLGGGKAIRYGIAVGMEAMLGQASARLPPSASGRTGRPRQVNCSGFRICPVIWQAAPIIR